MIVCLVIIIGLLIINFLVDMQICQEQEQERINQEIESDLIKLMQHQNELNNSSFVARKALIEEAIKNMPLEKQNKVPKKTQ